MDLIYHPENLVPGQRYEFIYRSVHQEDLGVNKVFSVLATFKKLSVGETESANEAGKRLKVVMRIGKEESLRHISWCRITRVTSLQGQT